METSEKKIPNYVFEDLLFERRLQRNLRDALERLNKLLAEQVELLQRRKELLADVHDGVQRRLRTEDEAMQESASSVTKEAGHEEE
jgi:hypothetical protein